MKAVAVGLTFGVLKVVYYAVAKLSLLQLMAICALLYFGLIF
jgi:hypothetical protein